MLKTIIELGTVTITKLNTKVLTDTDGPEPKPYTLFRIPEERTTLTSPNELGCSIEVFIDSKNVVVVYNGVVELDTSKMDGDYLVEIRTAEGEFSILSRKNTPKENTGYNLFFHTVLPDATETFTVIRTDPVSGQKYFYLGVECLYENRKRVPKEFVIPKETGFFITKAERDPVLSIYKRPQKFKEVDGEENKIPSIYFWYTDELWCYASK